MRILYVEDNISMARMVEHQLRACRYEFDTVHCGRDAIDHARHYHYDLILLDIMLPDLDGYEVIARLRDLGVDTPFLVQTGLIGREDDEIKGPSLGVTEYLVKPFNQAELVAGIETVVNRANQLDQLTQDPPVIDERARGLTSAEKRQHRRFMSQRSAQVVSPYTFECRILNMSFGGAAIRLPHPQRALSSTFRLSVDTGPALECLVCWRVDDKVGVRFV